VFIQVFQGQVSDEAGVRACMDRWTRDLQPDAMGFLGCTWGMCDDDMFVALVRFATEQDARRNSRRPEQGRWWDEMKACMRGEVAFTDCADVMEFMDGGGDGAGFVQIMEGHSDDMQRMRELVMATSERIHEVRPEIMGGMLCSDGKGGFVEAVYFRDENEARQHEKIEVPDDLRSLLAEEQHLMGEVSYYDMRRPMLVSAGG